MELRCKAAFLWIATAFTLTACNPVPAPAVQSTTTQEPVTTPTQQASTPIPSPTEAATPTPEIIPDVTITPVLHSLDEFEPIARAAQVTFEGWSPDGRYLLYRTNNQEQTAGAHEFSVPGEFFVYDTEQPESPCRQVTDHYETLPHFWASDDELIYVSDAGEVVRWRVCSDEQTVVSDLFPGTPGLVVASNVEQSQFLLGGYVDEHNFEPQYWLWNTATNTVHTLPEMKGIYGIAYGLNTSAWSPDGEHVTVSLINEEALGLTSYVINVQNGEVIQSFEQGGFATWISDTQFLISVFSQENQELLLVTVGGDVVPYWGEDDSAQPREFEGSVVVIPDEEDGTFHLLSLESEDEPENTVVRLYHPETMETETLPFEEIAYWGNSRGDVWLALQKPATPRDVILSNYESGYYGRRELWMRPVDPQDSEAHLLISPDYQDPQWSSEGTKVLAQLYKSDGRGVAVFSSPDGTALREWRIDAPVDAVLTGWSPDGEAIIVTTLMRDEEEDQLFILPVEP